MTHSADPPRGSLGTADLLTALQTSERRFRRLFEESPFGMVMLDAELRVVRANPALAAMLDHAPDELVGKSIGEITHPDDLEHTTNFLKTVNRPDVRQRQTEKRYLRKDGST